VTERRVPTTPLCLFCRRDSSTSRSEEHVLPQSLGNTTLVLPPGVVCDDCNNYFARKVEAPLLGSDPMMSMRHLEHVPNKRGRVPSLRAETSLGFPGELTFQPGRPVQRWLELPPEGIVEYVRRGQRLEVGVPDRDRVPADVLLGRFVCKVALEAAAARCLDDPLAYASLLDSQDLKDCRLHARYGSGPAWPVRVNRIHDPERMFFEDGQEVQRVWEHDFLHTPTGQVVFAMAIFGLEFAINVLERDTAAYDGWLARARCDSLLYPRGLPPER
jgi:hypothetical protein